MSYFNHNGCQLYYEDRGQGAPVLLVHGLGSSTQDWEYQIPHLAKNYRVLALDLRGHGRSDKPKEAYSMRLFADGVRALLDELRLPAVHLVGISMGGMVGFQLAVDQPERLLSLTAVNSSPEVKVQTLAERWMLAKRWTLARLLSLNSLGKAIGRLLFPHPEQAELRAKVEQRWPRNDKGAYLRSLDAIIGWSVREQLAQISCPTLVVSADQDYTPVVYKKAYSAEIPNARLAVIEQSRHATPMDQPQRFNALLDEFLQQVEHARQSQPHKDTASC